MYLHIFVSIPFQSVDKKKKAAHHKLQLKKIEDTLTKIEETTRQIKHAFEHCPEIRQVALVLGATTVTPKEIYVVQFPPLSPEADNLSTKECIKCLFRQLIMHDPLGHIKSVPITNITVLLNAPRHSSFTWFLPKALYKIPDRGNQFHFNLCSNVDFTGSQDLSKDFSVIDLSGFEPLGSSVIIDTSMSEDRSASSSECSASLSADYVCIDSDHDIEIVGDCDIEDSDITPKNLTVDSVSSDMSQEGKDAKAMDEVNDTDEGIHSLTDSDYIWFQSPIVVKGFKQKFSNHSNSGDML